MALCDWFDRHRQKLSRAALAQAACRAGFRALRTRVPRLLQELAVARADGSYVTVLNRMAQIHVLVLDDFSSRRSRTQSAAICSRCWKTATTSPPR